MAKIDIKDFRGIYTNIDSSDVNLDFMASSNNFNHRNRFAEVSDNALKTTGPQAGDMPNLDTYYGESGWTWETGSWGVISNDRFAEVDITTVFKSEVLILIAKNGNRRRVWLYSWRIDGLLNNQWIEMNSEAVNPYSLSHIAQEDLDFIFIPRDYFDTNLPGKTFIRYEDGQAKIYMPHACFIIGRGGRRFYNQTYNMVYPSQEPIWARNTYYIDYLIEGYESGFYPVKDTVHNVNLVPVVEQSNKRRVGANYRYEVLSTQSEVVDEVELTRGTINEQLEGNVYFWTWEMSDSDGNKYKAPEEVKVNELNDPFLWSAWQSDTEGGTPTAHRMIIDARMFDHISDRSGDDPVTYSIDQPGGYVTEATIRNDVTTLSGRFLRFDKSVFEARNWNLTRNRTIGDIGFDNTENEFDVVITATLDEKEEIIMERFSGSHTLTTGKWALKISRYQLAYDCSRRVTKTSFYIKLKTAIDYELVHEVDHLLVGDEGYDPYDTFTITDADLQGVFLSQRIGVLYDPEQPNNYKVITGFNDVALDRGVRIGLKTGDSTRLFYSTIGGGVLQNDLLYEANVLPLTEVKDINALAELNNCVGAIGDNTTFVIRNQEAAGTLAFSLQDTLEHGILEKDDITPIQGGVILNTVNGLYLIDGYRSSFLSEAINDIVENNSLASKIFYNARDHELYYMTTPSGTNLFYNFSFDDQSWQPKSYSEFVNVPIDQIEFINDIDGRISFLYANDIYSYDTDKSTITASMETHVTDLGIQDRDKLFNELVLDYEGDVNVVITTYTTTDTEQTTTWTVNPPTETDRIQRVFKYPLDLRKPFNKFKMTITASHPAKIYNIQLDVDALNRRVYV